ncbi:efflux RND transporter permease subunit [Longimicrobium sp.]|uniref:efflux RND transporter permease subunit n=1 Tax=Longimicrobium sp. TaxID=2029185 RepID=UPI002E30104B|nr:efflux RND transporter permease subunit [Longimicrobium sp.]HEX6041308.1 efflux RND transporter permease subunit [Longimicrobium sp.]
MFISNFSIRQPIVTIVVMLSLVVFGLVSLMRLQTDEFPEINPPIVSVAVPYPGASPEGVEREVVDPMEDAIASISGVDEITSTSTDGYAQIIVEFTFDKDVQVASQEVRDAISTIRGQLPLEMEDPVISRFDPNLQPIVSLTLASSRLTVAQLTQLADPGISGQLSGINGVATVEVVGGLQREMTVLLRPDALQAAGVSITEVVQALQAQNLAAPVGRVTGRSEERSIRLVGRLEDAAAFQALVVAQRGGTAIRLGDVATISVGHEEQRSLAQYNGAEAVGIDVVKSTGFSTTTVAEGVLKEVERIRKTLPAGTTLEVVRNSGVRVEQSVANVEHTLVEGLVLTILVVFLFLNSWRSTVITGLALPVSMLAAFVPIYLFGFTLNSMSLMGLSLAIGLIIDDAIVVRENIVRHVEMGKDHMRASEEGTDEIGLAVTATTFAIVVVFVPIGMMPGLAGQFFKPFALTIAAAVLVSLFVSFSLDPMLSAYWAEPHVPPEKRAFITRWVARFNEWFDRQADRYKGVIAWALDHRWLMVALAGGTFVGALALQVMFGGSGFAPPQDRSEITLALETPPGSSLEYTARKAEAAARLARAHPEVAYTYTTIGGASGAVDEGSVYVKLVPKAERDVGQMEFGQRLRREVGRIGGATFSTESGGFGGGGKPVQVQLRGPDAATLTRLADQVAERVEQVPGTADVSLSTRGQKPELVVTIDRALAGSLGLTVGQISQAMRPAFAGVDAGDWIDETGETRDVTVRLSPEVRTSAADLRTLPLLLSPGTGAAGSGAAGGGFGAAAAGGAAGGATGGGGPSIIPLSQVAEVTEGLGPAQIAHVDRERVVTVEANLAGADLGTVTAAVNRAVAGIAFPAGYEVVQGGEAQDQAEVFGSMFAALGSAIMLMYLVLVLQFRSFLDPVAILLSLPLSLIGVVLALLLTGDTLNMMSLIGVILLMGIVAKNAILLIDFAKWNHEQGVPLRESLIEAGRVRLRPILMTTFALVAAMIPVAIGAGEGADFRAPLGRAVIGGVIASTVLTLLVIPTFYEILYEWRERLMAFFRKRFGHGHTPHPPHPPHGGGLEPEAAD